MMLVSNPASAETSGTVFALSAYTDWAGVFSPPVLTPEVTRATGPVLRIGRRTGTTGEDTYFDGASMAVLSALGQIPELTNAYIA